MKSKWYFGVLIIALAFFVGSQQQFTVPNQKIVLQFSDATVTATEIENTIAIVKKQLVDLGVDTIQIHKIENGQLKITYYSEADVVSIKSKLSKKENLAIDYASKNKTEYPKNPSPKEHYDLDVYKILEASDSSSGFDGKVALEPKIESDRFFNPTVNFHACFSEEKTIYTYSQVAYKVNTTIAIAIDNTSYKIPEVRAGPFTNKTS